MYQPTHSYKIITEEAYSQQIDFIIHTISEHSVSGNIPSYDGLSLAYEYIPVEDAIGNIVIVHGYTEFYKKYYEIAWYFMNMGYNVFLYDQRGHGYSGRETESLSYAHVNSFDEYAKDLEYLIHNLIEKVASGLPLIAYSHSMGGSIVLLTLHRDPGLFDKIILSSPMIAPFTYMVPQWIVRRHAVQDIAKGGLDSRFRHAHDYNPNPTFEKSHDRSPARFLHNMELRNGDIHYQNSVSTNGWIYGSVSLQPVLLDRTFNATVKTPTLLLRGGKDHVVLLRPIARLAKQLPNARLVDFPNSYHSIYSGNSEQLEKYYNTIFSFLASDKQSV